MTATAPPFEQFYDLADLSEAGADVAVETSVPERERIARWADVVSVEQFEGRVALRRLSASRFAYEAALSADIVQSCVVTLEPVHTHIAREFHRELHLTPALKKAAAPGGEVPVSVTEDDGPEEIASTRFDLAAPLLEEFSLAIDPYPRAPGVEFEPPPSAKARPDSLFAVLKRLKAKD
jgi:hypothetical protein